MLPARGGRRFVADVRWAKCYYVSRIAPKSRLYDVAVCGFPGFPKDPTHLHKDAHLGNGEPSVKILHGWIHSCHEP